jgi:ElaB/YqjD/DUF883 family membrane-anchored ribosome-binding protein
MNAPDNTLAEQANRRVEGVIRSTQQAAHQAVDHLADGAEHLAVHADRLAQRSAGALRDGSEQLRERARHAADSTIVHIRQEPLKAVLIAGAIGAALGALFTLLGRVRS